MLDESQRQIPCLGPELTPLEVSNLADRWCPPATSRHAFVAIQHQSLPVFTILVGDSQRYLLERRRFRQPFIPLLRGLFLPQTLA